MWCGQLDRKIPATIRGQRKNPDAKAGASKVQLTDLGDFEDLESAKGKQDAALNTIKKQKRLEPRGAKRFCSLQREKLTFPVPVLRISEIPGCLWKRA